MTAPMRLLLIHGPPAAGKLTVGRELAALTGAPGRGRPPHAVRGQPHRAG